MTEPPVERIALVTDFGPGLYAGQMRAVLHSRVPEIPVIDLAHDLAPYRADLAAYLLPALMRDMPAGTLYLCVVDPGVGGERALLLMRTRAAWLIGPDNGVLARVAAGAPDVRVGRIGWTPDWTSSSFHGRDWIAPAAARLCRGQDLSLTALATHDLVGSRWGCSLAAIVYRDRYGNLMTGLSAEDHPGDGRLVAAGRRLRRARTFCEVEAGEPFWYENALGLVEIAVNQGRADRMLGLGPGDPVTPPVPEVAGARHHV